MATLTIRFEELTEDQVNRIVECSDMYLAIQGPDGDMIAIGSDYTVVSAILGDEDDGPLNVRTSGGTCDGVYQDDGPGLGALQDWLLEGIRSGKDNS